MIAQRLLCRWWYAIDWPRIQDIAAPPPGYEALEGFMGVFASTRVRAYICQISLQISCFFLQFMKFIKMLINWISFVYDFMMRTSENLELSMDSLLFSIHNIHSFLAFLLFAYLTLFLRTLYFPFHPSFLPTFLYFSFFLPSFLPSFNFAFLLLMYLFLILHV